MSGKMGGISQLHVPKHINKYTQVYWYFQLNILELCMTGVYQWLLPGGGK